MSDENEPNRGLGSMPADQGGDNPTSEIAQHTAGISIPQESWDAAVGNWVAEHVRGSAIAQDTEAWNTLHSIIGKLKEKLEEIL